ncbi:45 kDa calcium-binding protein-like isoform X2 [Mytilus californianus]|uniref:45 kDa calcium-binding protein-like isoform X2 n=1 Tax=Mytilus californianus TaxID=6549 RepID=UPI002245A542|nr:45 kDa calcium-binding protein-like isoform X2 [Mytilus californianus]
MKGKRLCIVITIFLVHIVNGRPKIPLNEVDVEKPLSLDKLEPPDHLEAVRFEQDGMLNKDFHKEAFIGNHEEIDDDPVDIADSKLKDIFNKVDTDSDRHMNLIEIESWIQDKIRQHFDEALEENAHIFTHMDPDGDGLVDWKDYYKHFLLAKKYDVDKIDSFLKDYGDQALEMKETDRDQLVRYKFKWTDVEQMPMDNKLNKEEFLAFRHPEQSRLAMKKMIESILNSLDTDNDGKLTLAEFVALPPGDVEDQEQKKLDDRYQDERKKEFVHSIDSDKNGVATQKELEDYVDPRNPQQSKAEAENLLQMLDDNKDGKVSMDEMFKHKDIFVDSKCVNVKRSLHDEF